MPRFKLSTIIGIIASAMLLGAIACIFLSVNDRGSVAQFFIGIFFTAFGCAVAASPCARMIERGKSVALMWCALATAVVCAFGWSMVIWSLSTTWTAPHPVLFHLFTILSIFLAWCAVYAMVMVHTIHLPVGNVMRGLTIGCASIAALLIFIAILDAENVDRGDGGIFRVIGVMLILTLLGCLLTLIVARRKELTLGGTEADHAVRMKFVIWCPRCELQQEIQTAGDTCRGCGLEIRVTLT